MDDIQTTENKGNATITAEVFQEPFPPTAYALWIQTIEDNFVFRYDGTVLHNAKEIGKSQELIDEMLIFFKKANLTT